MKRDIPLEDKSLLRGKWPVVFSVILISLFSLYYIQSQTTIVSPGSFLGMLYGIISMLLVLFLLIYRVRKKLFRYKLGTMQNWLQGHIYIGVICLIINLMHSGASFGGHFSAFFSVLFFLVIVSGIVGSLIYVNVPLSITKYGKNVMTLDDLTSELQQHLKKADKIAEHTSESFKDMYKKSLRPCLSKTSTNWGYLFLIESELLIKRQNLIEDLRAKVSSEDIYDLDAIGEIMETREKIAYRLMKTNLLQKWLLIHIPLSFLMLVLLIIHITITFYY
ncbi:MAG: hypothetical protein HQK84_08955 [Nitrospinae bacterium]|nr:hypothetical protein [Nitrospinota bacterium]